MSDVIEVCVDWRSPDTESMLAREFAIMENPDNQFAHRSGTERFGSSEVLKMAIDPLRMWKRGRTLGVSFINGTDGDKEIVKNIAPEWSNYANIKFDFVSQTDQEAHIRIYFNYQGRYSSLVGTDSLTRAKSQATMHLGWVRSDMPDEFYVGYVLHEFGHALGCIHEHQNPEGNIPWNEEAVYTFYKGAPYNWRRKDVVKNIFQRYSRTLTNFSKFDPDSIMVYPIPNKLTEGDFEVVWNGALSQKDKEFIGRRYPFVQRQKITLIPGAPAADGQIDTPEEEDWFEFVVDDQRRWIVETHGETNVMMALYGPNEENEWVAGDDDGGQQRNAKIVKDLKPGKYFVAVRHYDPASTGPYQVSVRPA